MTWKGMAEKCVQHNYASPCWNIEYYYKYVYFVFCNFFFFYSYDIM